MAKSFLEKIPCFLNSVRILEELFDKYPLQFVPHDRILDLGCDREALPENFHALHFHSFHEIPLLIDEWNNTHPSIQDKQEELSPDAQKRLILEYAKKNQIVVPENGIFLEEGGISGKIPRNTSPDRRME